MNLDYTIPKIERELIKNELSKDKFISNDSIDDKIAALIQSTLVGPFGLVCMTVHRAYHDR